MTVMSRYACFLFLLCAFACSRKRQVTIVQLPEPAKYAVHFSKLPKSYTRQMQERLRKFWYDRLNVTDFSGMMLVAKNGQILFEHYSGWADFGSKVKMSANQPLHVASVSKTITAVIVLKLVDQGKLQLTDKVTQHLKTFPFADVTVRDLLNHRSGVPYYGYFPDTIWPLKEKLSNQDVLDALAKNALPQNFPADSHFAYSNTNFALLALIVEKIEKKPFPQVAKELIFRELEMKHSFILDATVNTDSISQSYKRHAAQEFNKLDFIYGDKNLYTTVRDLFRFSQALYSDEFLSADMKQEMFHGYSYEKPGKANYGLGIRIREVPGKEMLTFHTGWWHGNTSCLAMMRPDSACAIIISNSYNRRVYAINRISLLFGNYPYEDNVDVLSGIMAEKSPQKLKE